MGASIPASRGVTTSKSWGGGETGDNAWGAGPPLQSFGGGGGGRYGPYGQGPLPQLFQRPSPWGTYISIRTRILYLIRQPCFPGVMHATSISAATVTDLGNWLDQLSVSYQPLIVHGGGAI